MSLSFILSNQSNIFLFKKTIFLEIFSSKNVEKIARDCGAMIRSRKLKINKYIISALSVLSNSPNTVYNVYDKLAEESLGENFLKSEFINVWIMMKWLNA